MDSGTCGENLTWTLDIKGALTISGNGEMENWPWNVNEPWHNHRDSVNQIIIEEGITSISAHAFQGCKNVETVKIPDGVTVIGNLAFADCTSLSMVYIPDSVTNIVLAAFSNCTSLSNVTIPCYLSPIDEQIFAGCTSLTEINVSSYNAEKATVQSVDGVLFSANGRLLVEFPAGRTGYYSIPDGVTTIGSGAFDGCLLSSVRIPDSVSVIGSYAFGGCRNLASVLLPDGITEIYFDAFGNCMNLKEITIPATVKLIDDKALGYYWNATEYKKVEGFTIHGRIGTEAETYAKANGFQFVPINTQKQIVSSGTCGENLTWTLEEDGTLTVSGTGRMDSWSYAGSGEVAPWYENRGEIHHVILTEGVTSIGQYAFDGCHSLASVTIPSSVAAFESGAFISAENITELYLSDLAAWCNAKFEPVSSPLWQTGTPTKIYLNGQLLKDVVIPEGVAEIPPEAFAGCPTLTSVQIPASVKSIGEGAFDRCGNLNSVSIEYGLKTIGNSAFGDCIMIDTITLPDSVVYIGQFAFYGCSGLSRVSLPDTVTEIPRRAFYGCRSLTNLTFPKKLCEIGEEAFAGCTGLTEVSLPTTVTWIGDSAFKDCGALKSVSLPDGIEQIRFQVFEGCNSLTSITLPESVTYLNPMAFRRCSSLSEIQIPENVTWISNNVFEDCTNLRKIVFSGMAPQFENRVFKNVTAKAYYPAEEASWTEEIRQDYGGNIKWIPIIPEGTAVGGICGDNTAWTLEADGTLTISGSGSMLDYCDSTPAPWYGYKDIITKVVIQRGVTSIGEYAFYDCMELTSAAIPNSVISIGDQAFPECRVADLYIDDIVSWLSISFGGDTANPLCGDRWRTLYIDGTAVTELAIPEGITSIPQSAFSGCIELASVTIPEGVTSIGNYAFYGSGLTDLNIPDGVTDIGMFAFYSCEDLPSVTLPKSVAAIGQGAFCGCENLTDVNYGGSEASKEAINIGQMNEKLLDATWHFMEIDYNGLKALELPGSVTTIDSQAFIGTAAEVIIIPESCTSVAADAFENCPNLKYIVNRSKVTLTLPDGVSVIAE